MSALKWHLCDRLWEIRSPLTLMTTPVATAPEKADGHDEERAPEGKADECIEGRSDPSLTMQIATT